MKVKIILVSVLALIILLAVIALKDAEYLRIGNLSLRLKGFEKMQPPTPEYPASLINYTIFVAPFDLIDGFSQNEADAIHDFFNREFDRVWGIKVIGQNGVDEEANCIIYCRLEKVSEQLVINVEAFDVNTKDTTQITPLKAENYNGLVEKLTSYVAEIINVLPGSSGSYDIGGRGPGGGIIFYSFYGHYMECSGDLGEYNWDDANAVAKKYNGGNFVDWRLPNLRELEFIYRNLKARNIGNFQDAWYWSSTGSPNNILIACQMNFSNGMPYKNRSKHYSELVVAVRVFVEKE